jgi:hypothetical protein
MATTTITLDDTKIGTIISPVSDGFITRFELVTSQQPAYQADGWSERPFPHGSFAGGGRLILRESDGLGRRILSFNPTFEFSPIILNASLGYRAGLMLESCPAGAAYRLDISDQPVTQARAA